jgi:hypothetical protein
VVQTTACNIIFLALVIRTLAMDIWIWLGQIKLKQRISPGRCHVMSAARYVRAIAGLLLWSDTNKKKVAKYYAVNT